MKLLFNFLILSVVVIAKANDWSHQHQAKWYDNYKECSLNRQSPIEINAREVIIAVFIPPLIFHNYNATCPKAAAITNNGHTATIALSKECTKPQLTGGPLPYDATYEAVSFHFHWGSQDSHGSEHIINSKRHSIEAHIVHRNLKYPTMEEAGQHRDGLLVQAFFYDAQETTKKEFNGLQSVVKSLNAITKFNTTAAIKGLRLADLLGDMNTSRFYTYQGSLTTPPCSQAVTWIVFPQAINISQTQVQQFRLLSDGQGDALVNNYRFLQPRGGRKVYLRHSVKPPAKNTTVAVPHYQSPSTPGPFDEEVNTI